MWSLFGAALTASLVHRFDIPSPMRIEVWRRDLPLIWSAGGATLAAAAAVLLPVRRTDPPAP